MRRQLVHQTHNHIILGILGESETRRRGERSSLRKIRGTDVESEAEPH